MTVHGSRSRSLVRDDQDSYKLLADESGLAHSICRARVNLNVARLTGELARHAREVTVVESPP